ncbi:MAG TPA: type IV secretion protein Rhs, partial [Burkholderiaceae bacterium]|nr:type IV secretion protein Rhs [Burkholderiaceae bacterium]
ADARLEIDAADGSVMFVCPGEGPALFPALPAAPGDGAAVLELMDGALLSDHGDEWRVRTKADLIYHFPKALAAPADAGLREVPLGRVSDLCGNWLLYEWVDGRLREIRESGGRHLLVEYAGRFIRALTLFVPEAGFSHTFVSYEHDERGNLTAVRDELGEPYRFAYEGRRMVRHTNRTGLSFHYAYDGERVVHAWGDGGLYDYRFAYLPAIREVRITDSLGHVSTVQCSEHGLPILEIDPLGGRTIFEYDEAGRTTAVVDAANHRTEYAYDERGNLRKLTRPDGSALAIEVDAGNKPVAVTDPNGATWRQRWDERGLLAEQTSPLGATTTYEYSDTGLLVGVTDALQASTRLGYDSDGHLVSIRNALGHETRLKRDLLGNVLERADPLGRSTQYRYDVKSRLVEATLPGGARVRCAYDAQDNLTHHEDENGARTGFEYFGQGLVAKRHQSDGHVVQYHYDTEEQLVGVSNQRGERYELRRDALGRVVEEVDYWGQATRYSFDLAGHLKQSCDPLGRVVDYTTDKLGRIRRKGFEHPLEAGRRFEESFEFDANGNLTGCANEHVTVTRTLDAEGRLVEERLGEFVIRNSFDMLGRRIRRETSAGHTVAYAYDALGQPTAIRIDDEPPIAIERDAAGQVVKETLAPALERHYRYDAEGRVTTQGVRREAEWLFNTQYGYDAAGNLTHRKDSQQGLDQYRYDPLGQIVEHVDPQGKLKRFFQDPAGDRLVTRVRENGP